MEIVLGWFGMVLFAGGENHKARWISSKVPKSVKKKKRQKERLRDRESNPGHLRDREIY